MIVDKMVFMAKTLSMIIYNNANILQYEISVIVSGFICLHLDFSKVITGISCYFTVKVLQYVNDFPIMRLLCVMVSGPTPPTVIISPPGPIPGAIVGDPLIIECFANTTEIIDVDLVMFNWTGPSGDAITSNSRVTINLTTSNGNTHASSIQFAYLMEGDEGIYMCDVTILTVNGIESVVVESLTSELNSFY